MRPLVGLFLALLAVTATAATVTTGHAAAQTPQAVSGKDPSPRRVSVRTYVVDVVRIDDAAQTVEAHFILWLLWKDPSLQSEATGKRVLDLGEVWSPEISVVNGLRLRKQRPDTVEVSPDGTVSYRQRYIGELSLQLDLSEFPLDRQQLRIEVLCPHSADEVAFELDPSLTGRSETMSIPDWALGTGTWETQTLGVSTESFAGFVYSLPAERHIGFYIWSVILPLVLIVFMSWSVFWIAPIHAAAQIGLGATSVLTLVAYRFALASQMPNLSYLTRMDRFMVGASVLVFLALVEVVVTSNLLGQNKEALAGRIDRSCRWLFPLAFAILVPVAFFL